MVPNIDPHNLTDAEIVKIAIRQEERGHRFYSTVAKTTTDPEVRQMFLRLAEEERDHAQVFKQILDSIQQSSLAVFGKGSIEYMKAILEKGIFENQPNMEQLPEIHNFKDALVLAIQAEKDAILLYQEIINNCQSQEAKRTIEKMLEAEKLHLVDLRSNLEES